MEHESNIFIFHLKHWNVGMLECALTVIKFGQFKNYVYLCTPFHDKRQYLYIIPGLHVCEDKESFLF